MFIGSLLVSLWAGVFVDRLSRKSILIASDLIRALLVVVIPTLIQVNLWLVYLDLALISIATAFFRPAIFAIVPQVVQRRDLMAANSFFTAMETGTEIFGPIAAGFLAQSYGYAPLLYADGLTYVVSALCVSAMLVSGTARRERRLDFKAVWDDVLEGLKYIRRDALQRGLFLLIFPATLVGAGLNALQTPLAKGEIGITDAQFGTFQSVWGLGFLVASLILAWYGGIFRKSTVIIAGYFLGFSATAIMGLSTGYKILLMTAFAVGFSNTLYYVGLGTVLMEYTPSDLVGRVVSTRQVALASARVVSPLVFGAIATVSGIRASILLMAIVGAVGTAIAVLRNPSVWQFDRERKPGTSRSWSVVKRFTEPTDPDFEEGPQRLLNAVAILAAVIAWSGVAIRNREAGLALLFVIPLLGYLGSLLKRKGLLP